MLEYYEKYIQPENEKLEQMLIDQDEYKKEVAREVKQETCDHPDTYTEDLGIGQNEFWGAIGNDKNVRIYCTECEKDLTLEAE